ncbi:MAG TPA: VIT1/CCC1 transporter family protein [Gemmatimonadales bacterium]|nr:VIT1/CCC1 transporter family protein [Gemmatimonadales bacterium]
MERAATLGGPHASDQVQGESRRVLEPLERLSEILFGLIMALTFTTTLSVATAGREDVREMLIGALGCNIAWGFIDGVFYILGTLAERHRNLTILQKVRGAISVERVRGLIADALPPLVASVMRPSDLDYVRQQLSAMPQPRTRVLPTMRDLQGALAVFLIVVGITVPVALPFVFIQQAHLALRVSNGIALVLLFATGYLLGRYAGRPPVRVGVIMTVIGLVLVGATIALGG